MKKSFFLLILLCVLIGGSSCSLAKTPLPEMVKGVTLENVMDNFDEHFEEYNMVANLLAENSEIFIQEPGRQTGSFYRDYSSDWSVILDAKEWNPEELELLHQVIDTNGLINIGYAHGVNFKCWIVYFGFRIPNDNGYLSSYYLEKCITDDQDPVQCASEEVEYYQKSVEDWKNNPHYQPLSEESYYTLPEYPGWYFVLHDTSQKD